MLSEDEVKRKEADLALFWKNVRLAYEQALRIVVGRATSRDVGMTPWDKMAYGELSYATFIFHKAARLASMVQVTPLNEPGQQEKIDDELLDIINYCAMMWAYRGLKEANKCQSS